MSVWEVPYGYRVLAVLAFLSTASLVEIAFRGKRSVRWRASLFLVAAGAGGGAFGTAADAVTSSISEAYFALGKGLGGGEGLRARALALGLRAGVSAGAVLGCALLLASRAGRRPPGSLVFAGRQLWLPAACSAAAGVAGGLTGACALPLDLLGAWRSVLPDGEARRFATVWVAHWGLYLGAAFGAAIGIRRCVRHRSPDRAWGGGTTGEKVSRPLLPR